MHSWIINDLKEQRKQKPKALQKRILTRRKTIIPQNPEKVENLETWSIMEDAMSQAENEGAFVKSLWIGTVRPIGLIFYLIQLSKDSTPQTGRRTKILLRRNLSWRSMCMEKIECGQVPLSICANSSSVLGLVPLMLET